MRVHKQHQETAIVGIELRTSNDVAFTEIPKHWKRFTETDVAQRVRGKISDDVYAVYTNFENQGSNNKGTYSFILGYAVEDAHEPAEGLASAVIPASSYEVFNIPDNDPSKVGDVWMKIWALKDQSKTFVCDFEKYGVTGDIEIFVGVD